MNALLTSVMLLSAIGNLGFEDGKKELSSVPKNASFDTTVFRSGAQSLKLEVKDYKNDAVYVTRMIPVKPGEIFTASVWLKIADAVRAPVKNGPIGAGLLVEWADAKGHWMLGPGAKHVANHYGTHDWQQVVAKGICVPEKAAYAIVYFAMRAGGTAWFDDFEFYEDYDSVFRPTFPANGSKIGTNRPRFEWRSDGMQIANYRLKLSTDPSFPEGNTMTVMTGFECAYRFDKPLKPGKYYWMVMPPTLEKSSKVWSFEQPIPEDADVTPPELITRGARVYNNTTAICIMVREDTGKPASAQLGNMEATEIEYVANDVWRVEFRMSGKNRFWKRGLSDLRLTVSDAAGNRMDETFYVLNAPEPKRKIKVAADGRYEENGKRIFPIGIYQVSTNCMAEVKAAGFDIVHVYDWENVQDNERPRQYLDACERVGLKAFVGFDRGSWNRQIVPNGICQGNFNHIAQRVAALSNHSGLFCWYLFDEPSIDYQYVAPSRLTECANLIRALDPYHPVVVSVCGEMRRDYIPSFDTHWSQLYNNSKMNHQTLADQRKYLGDNVPVTMLVACYMNKHDYDANKDFRIKELNFRSRAYLSLAEGTNGLFWWWFARDNALFATAAQDPKAWAELKKVVAEMREMLPIINAPGKAERGATPDGAVLWWRKTAGGKTLLVAVNISNKQVKAMLDLPNVGATEVNFLPDEAKRW